jgi:hypothetical protein
VRLDPKESLTKMHEDHCMENSVRIQIQVLNSILPEEALEEITRWAKSNELVRNNKSLRQKNKGMPMSSCRVLIVGTLIVV